MRALIQRVSRASVSSAAKYASIEGGLLVLLGVKKGDTAASSKYLAEKTLNLRVFESTPGKMDRSLLDVKGGILAISQFTLYADTRRGRRPGFTGAAPPDAARELFECYCDFLNKSGLKVEKGFFGKHMKVSLENDGPVTIMLESDK